MFATKGTAYWGGETPKTEENRTKSNKALIFGTFSIMDSCLSRSLCFARFHRRQKD